jgi:hypothetical protein
VNLYIYIFKNIYYIIYVLIYIFICIRRMRYLQNCLKRFFWVSKVRAQAISLLLDAFYSQMINHIFLILSDKGYDLSKSEAEDEVLNRHFSSIPSLVHFRVIEKMKSKSYHKYLRLRMNHIKYVLKKELSGTTITIPIIMIYDYYYDYCCDYDYDLGYIIIIIVFYFLYCFFAL